MFGHSPYRQAKHLYFLSRAVYEALDQQSPQSPHQMSCVEFANVPSIAFAMTPAAAIVPKLISAQSHVPFAEPRAETPVLPSPFAARVSASAAVFYRGNTSIHKLETASAAEPQAPCRVCEQSI